MTVPSLFEKSSFLTQGLMSSRRTLNLLGNWDWAPNTLIFLPSAAQNYSDRRAWVTSPSLPLVFKISHAYWNAFLSKTGVAGRHSCHRPAFPECSFLTRSIPRAFHAHLADSRGHTVSVYCTRILASRISGSKWLSNLRYLSWKDIWHSERVSPGSCPPGL